MTTSEAILQHVRSLPGPAQQEVLDFVLFLKTRQNEHGTPNDGLAWAGFSLAAAMRGMEAEQTPYTHGCLRLCSVFSKS